MKFIPDALNRTVSRQILLGKKHSPTILFGLGVVGVIGTTVAACKATLRLEEILNETNTRIDNLHDNAAGMTEDQAKKHLGRIYANSALSIAKLYGPSFVLGVTSIACLAGSHNILTKRNAALVGTLATVEKAFDEYRKRVSDEFGEEKERDIRFGAETKTFIEETDQGPQPTEEQRAGNTKASPYAQWFAEGNPNFQRNYPEDNRIFLDAQREYANKRLRAKGFVMLNDVYRSLGLQETSAGAVVGWVYGNGDNLIDFGIGEWPSANHFIEGAEDALLLDFNVDGRVFDMIDDVQAFKRDSKSPLVRKK